MAIALLTLAILSFLLSFGLVLFFAIVGFSAGDIFHMLFFLHFLLIALGCGALITTGALSWHRGLRNNKLIRGLTIAHAVVFFLTLLPSGYVIFIVFAFGGTTGDILILIVFVLCAEFFTFVFTVLALIAKRRLL
ncbi:hypothetical protein M427DRAFT_52366 [Gonapodya prolifera JEL478]|uniref:Uncharacterized protein n=1 Tax=Gonapodya prolifera (strain JEL478) TaxID=1344416 RepID=A0A139ATP8_GONPJ|nr:hypothetical protein M427DRAFT_52366 [Gonapodya prolifera JEL478]|eukprot:KXS20106.1 hypothetical protein M427DRAFT_52366 [Gonapodya prolifera JEL478]